MKKQSMKISKALLGTFLSVLCTAFAHSGVASTAVDVSLVLEHDEVTLEFTPHGEPQITGIVVRGEDTFLIKDLKQNGFMVASIFPSRIGYKVITNQANVSRFAGTLCRSQGGLFLGVESELIPMTPRSLTIATQGSIGSFGVDSIIPVYTADLKMNPIRGDRFFWGHERFSVISAIRCKLVNSSSTSQMQATLNIR